MDAQATAHDALFALHRMQRAADQLKAPRELDGYLFEIQAHLTRLQGQLLIAQGELHRGLCPVEGTPNE